MAYRSPDVAVQEWPIEALHGRAGGFRELLEPLLVVFGFLLLGAYFVAVRLYVPESIWNFGASSTGGSLGLLCFFVAPFLAASLLLMRWLGSPKGTVISGSSLVHDGTFLRLEVGGELEREIRLDEARAQIGTWFSRMGTPHGPVLRLEAPTGHLVIGAVSPPLAVAGIARRPDVTLDIDHFREVASRVGIDHWSDS